MIILQAWYDIDFKIKKMSISMDRPENYIQALTLLVIEAI